MTVSELLGRISSVELSEWMAFFQMEPFGAEIDLLGHTITSATVANAHKPKGHRAYKPSDFMPELDKPPQTVEEMIQFATMMTAAFKGRMETEDVNDS